MKNLIEILKRGEYEEETQTFKNMKAFKMYKEDVGIFELESVPSREEKIEIMDKYSDGLATYMLNLISKWETEKDSLPKDSFGQVKTVSKTAWAKRSDIRKATYINVDNKITYTMFDIRHYGLSMTCGTHEYGYSMKYTGEDIVNEWFHDFCKFMRNKDIAWFKANDPIQLKIKTLKEYGNRYRVMFNCRLLNDIVYNRKEDVTDKELDVFIGAYIALEKAIEEQTQKITGLLGEDVMYKEDE